MDIVKNLAKVEISDDIMSKIDMQGLANEFKAGFNKLDDFQKIKEKYENRSWWEKIADAVTFDNTMEQAERNAIVAQGDFLKITGRLMVLNIALSKEMNKQQNEILEHQKKLELNSENIAEQTGELVEQQNALERQHNELSDLLKKYMELKGLTREGAQKLIEIAQDVCSVKENMEKSFDVFEREMESKINEVYDLYNKSKAEFKEDSIKFKNDIHNIIKENENEMKIKFDGIKLNIEEREIDLLDKINRVEDEISNNRKSLNDSLEDLRNELKSYHIHTKEEIVEFQECQNSKFEVIKNKFENAELFTKNEISLLKNEINGKNNLVNDILNKLTNLEENVEKNEIKNEKHFRYMKMGIILSVTCIAGIIIQTMR